MGKTFSAALAVIVAVLAAIFRPVHDALFGYLQRTGAVLMVAPTNTHTSYNLRGNKEDVDNKIYNLDPEETPFVSGLGEAFKAEARTHEWQEDTYAAANKDNARVEGDDFSGQAQVATLMMRNALQTFTKDVVTSGIADEIGKYGRSDEHAYLLGKAVVEIRKDIEAAMLSANPGVAGNNTTASKMAGLELYANINVSHGAGGSTPASVNATLPTVAPTDGTQRALTEVLFTSLMRTMWENGGKPKVSYLAMTQKNVVNSFAGIADRRVDVKPRGFASVIGVVDIYVWETGPVAFVPVYSDRIRARTLFITDGESVKRGRLRPVKKLVMGKTGDNKKTMLVTDVTMKVSNRRGIAKLADLT
jgi:hypothetical protein